MQVFVCKSPQSSTQGTSTVSFTVAVKTGRVCGVLKNVLCLITENNQRLHTRDMSRIPEKKIQREFQISISLTEDFPPLSIMKILGVMTNLHQSLVVQKFEAVYHKSASKVYFVEFALTSMTRR